MAASAAEHATNIPGAQHHEVSSNDPEYQKIKLELENTGLTLKRLVKLTNADHVHKFQMEADYLVKVRPEGKHLLSLHMEYGKILSLLFFCLFISFLFGHSFLFWDFTISVKFGRRCHEYPRQVF